MDYFTSCIGPHHWLWGQSCWFLKLQVSWLLLQTNDFCEIVSVFWAGESSTRIFAGGNVVAFRFCWVLGRSCEPGHLIPKGPAFWRLGPEGFQFQATQGYTARPCFKTKQKQNKTNHMWMWGGGGWGWCLLNKRTLWKVKWSFGSPWSEESVSFMWP